MREPLGRNRLSPKVAQIPVKLAIIRRADVKRAASLTVTTRRIDPYA